METSVLQDQQYIFGVRSLLTVEKVLMNEYIMLMKNTLTSLLIVRINTKMNMEDMLEKNVWFNV